MDKIYKLFEKDEFAKFCGVKIEEIKKGYARTSVIVSETHLNGLSRTQGGLIYTLADVAFAAAANSYGAIAVGLTTSISFLKATKKGDKLIATANVISLTRKTCSVDVKVICNDVLISKMTGTAFILNE